MFNDIDCIKLIQEEIFMSKIELRNMTARDLSLLSKVFSKLNLVEDIKGLFRDVSGAKTESDKKLVEQTIATELIMLIVENYWKAEKEVIKLISSLSGESEKQIGELSGGEFIELIISLKDDKMFGFFFNSKLTAATKS